MGMASFHDHSLMQATGFCHSAKAGQHIGDHFTSHPIASESCAQSAMAAKQNVATVASFT